MDLSTYLEQSTGVVEESLQEFVRNRYQDELSEMAVYLAVGGKRLRGALALLVCEAVGGDPKEATTAAVALELAQAASLAKDDVMDRDTTRRGKPAFWRRFGLDLAILVPDIIMPHATLLTQRYGLRATIAVTTAWAQVTRGQLMDSPRVRRPALINKVKSEDYERIIGFKTAPLFEVACELGIRASRKDWLVNLGKQFGHSCGMAFQVVDDATDLMRAEGRSWEEVARGDLPVSLQSLKLRLDSGSLVTRNDIDRVIILADQYIDAAERSANAFPESHVKELLIQFPRFCCDLLLKEAGDETRDSDTEVREASVGSENPA